MKPASTTTSVQESPTTNAIDKALVYNHPSSFSSPSSSANNKKYPFFLHSFCFVGELIVVLACPFKLFVLSPLFEHLLDFTPQDSPALADISAAFETNQDSSAPFTYGNSASFTYENYETRGFSFQVGSVGEYLLLFAPTTFGGVRVISHSLAAIEKAWKNRKMFGE